jgi:hypothetical protein
MLSEFLPLPSVQSNRMIFFRITLLYHMAALWWTSLNLSDDIMGIVGHLTTGSISDVIALVGVTSSWCYRVIAPVGLTSSWRRRIICNITAKLWVLNFWIKFATIQAKNASKCSHLVSCDKQKSALVFFFLKTTVIHILSDIVAILSFFSHFFICNLFGDRMKNVF